MFRGLHDEHNADPPQQATVRSSLAGLMPLVRARAQGAAGLRTSLDFARPSWYQPPMIKCSRKVNFNHMTRFGWAVEGVVR